MSEVFFLSDQLKKTVEELNDALATKEEIAQRCHELDMQVKTSTVCLTGTNPDRFTPPSCSL